MKLKRSVKFIIPAVVVVLIVVAVVVHALPKKKQTNSADAAGNTAGNLMNGGLFCEYNNKIYFANPYFFSFLIYFYFIFARRSTFNVFFPSCATSTPWNFA